jgi:hypothetical protein
MRTFFGISRSRLLSESVVLSAIKACQYSVSVSVVKRHLAAMKPKTVNCVLTVLSKLLKVAVDWKELASMPVSVKMVKSPDPELPFYDFEEFEQLVEGGGKAGADVLALVLLAGEAGLRRFGVFSGHATTAAGEGRSSRWSARTSTSSATRSRCDNPTGKGRSTRRRAARRDACR